MTIFGDFGREIVVIVACARQGQCGVSLADIMSTAYGQGISSTRRVRAICARLEQVGVAHVNGTSPDRRRRPLIFGGTWFDESMLDWLRLTFEALSPWDRTLPGCGLSALERMCRFIEEALRSLGAHPVLAWPAYRQVRDRLAGLPVLADLVGSVRHELRPLVPTFSRKALALAYGVSRIHVSGLINLFEAHGWLVRSRSGPGLNFEPECFARIRWQFARELAWMGLVFADG